MEHFLADIWFFFFLELKADCIPFIEINKNVFNPYFNMFNFK